MKERESVVILRVEAEQRGFPGQVILGCVGTFMPF